MKIKYYLRGLGTGILITTLILFVAYSYRDTKEKNEEKTTTESTTPQETSSKDETSEVETSETKTSETETSETETSETETSETETSETEMSEPVTEETTTAPIIDNTVTTVTFTIPGGYTAYAVAELLQSLGVIENAAEFDAYLVDNGYSYYIAAGEHTVTVGDSYEELAKAITN